MSTCEAEEPPRIIRIKNLLNKIHELFVRIEENKNSFSVKEEERDVNHIRLCKKLKHELLSDCANFCDAYRLGTCHMYGGAMPLSQTPACGLDYMLVFPSHRWRQRNRCLQGALPSFNLLCEITSRTDEPYNDGTP